MKPPWSNIIITFVIFTFQVLQWFHTPTHFFKRCCYGDTFHMLYFLVCLCYHSFVSPVYLNMFMSDQFGVFSQETAEIFFADSILSQLGFSYFSVN